MKSQTSISEHDNGSFWFKKPQSILGEVNSFSVKWMRGDEIVKEAHCDMLKRNGEYYMIEPIEGTSIHFVLDTHNDVNVTGIITGVLN